MQPVTRGMQLWAPTKPKDPPGVSAPRANGRVPHVPHYPRSPQVQTLTVPTRPLGQRKQANVWAGPMSSVTAGPRPASTLQITAGELLQTLVSCKTAVSHAWLILPTSPAGCGHMSSPAGTFCPAPPRISSLRARGFSRRPSRSGSSEKTKTQAVGLVAA